MKKRKLSIISTLCCVAAFAAAVSISGATVNAATPTETYSWNKAKTGAGGGFIPAIIFNQGEKDLIYTRTDMGGIYRWEPSTESWKALTDWVSHDDWNLLGCESLAADPVETNRVYAAVGTYTNEWTKDNGAILRSTDKGENWERINLPFKVGGNMPGRSMGERLTIDPNDNRILYLGTHNGNGLWKSTDYGSTWSKVESFTAVGNYTDEFFKDQIGVVWVTIDPTTGSKGSASQTIYVGVADTDNSIYKSTDGGATWEAVAGQPNKVNQTSWVKSNEDKTSTGYLPHHGVLSSDGYLYVSYSNTCGPYDGTKGDLWKYNTKTGEWTNIAPVKTSSGDNYAGYAGLAVDPENPQTIVVTNLSWWPDVQMYRSTDGGATWKAIWSWVQYPTRTFNYTQDISKAPWLDWGGNPNYPEKAPKLGWMVGGISIDPFNSNRMMYGTGATLYGTDNLTDWDKEDGKVNISVKAEGIEEASVSTVVSPPSGAHLISGMGDVSGFVHDDLTKAPSRMLLTPAFSTTSLDFAELKPNFVVRSGNVSKDNMKNTRSCAFSYDGGKDWFTGQDVSGLSPNSGGTVAAAADAKSVVWSPSNGGAVSYTTNNGSAWTASTGIPSGAKVISDRVNGQIFYGYADGKFYISKDAGATFTATAATGLNEVPANETDDVPTISLKAVSGKEGEIWITGYGMWHSIDYGQTFVKVDGVELADTIGYGKAADGANYVSIYTNAKINGVRGIFRSNDEGKTWVKINDDKHQYGSANSDISGDPRVYGRVYIATNGLGVVYGDATESPKISLKGDVNGDNVVNILDYATLQKYIKSPTTTKINTENSDVNGDGSITVADLLSLRKLILQA